MILKENVSLKNKNTFHIDAKAKKMYIPESVNDLIELLKKIENEEYYILSGGSNILLNDKKEYEHIIYMSDIDNKIENIKDGKFYIGASNKIQTVINEINKQGYGGIERLYSLPAMFGGIIYMNAGIGEKNNPVVTISEFIIKVKLLNKNNLNIEWLDKEKCNFLYRKSKFQNNKYIILGAECEFIKQDIKESKKIIKDRIDSFYEKADMGKGTFGTVFSSANWRLLKIVSIFNNKKGNIRFGKNNKNWLVNDGNGKYHDAIDIINSCKKIHKLFHQDIECEVRIWD